MNRAQKAIEFIPCPRCGAQPGVRCHTSSGHAYGGTWYVHQPRLDPFEQEWKDGWKIGRNLGDGEGYARGFRDGTAQMAGAVTS